MTYGPHPKFASLLPSASLQKLVSEWLLEDTPSFDYGGHVVGNKESEATLYMKAKGVVAGVPFFNEVFRQVQCRVEWFVQEGDHLDPDVAAESPTTSDAKKPGRRAVAKVYGNANAILLGERPALNMIARASGIATRCRDLLLIKQAAEWNGIIAGTRKTTPGFRLVEKYAMLVGGIDMHRMDLSSMIMLKDNHIKSTGDIPSAVAKARSVGGFALKIEVECKSIEEARTAIQAGADVVMLDNFSPSDFVQAAKLLKQEWSLATGLESRKFLIEGSGGLTPDNIHMYFSPDVDILSSGVTTQSVPHIDFSLKL